MVTVYGQLAVSISAIIFWLCCDCTGDIPGANPVQKDTDLLEGKWKSLAVGQKFGITDFEARIKK